MKEWIKTGLIISAILLVLNLIINGRFGRNPIETALLLVIIVIIGFGLSLLTRLIGKLGNKENNKKKK